MQKMRLPENMQMAGLITMDKKMAEYQKERLNRYKQQLKQRLIELFQIDSPDLDFGVYRIMNQKRDEILRFMDEDLIEAVDKEFGKYDLEARSNLVSEKVALEKKIQEELSENALQGAGIRDEYLNTKLARDLQEKWLALQKAEDEASMSDLQKAEIFSHLEEFFSRYYKDGDFLSLRKYADKYAIPYQGEEVLLHWANKDQYYIKTDRFLKSHGFNVGEYRVMFEIVRVEGQSNNNGKGRYFVLAGNDDDITYDSDKRLLTVRFAHIPLSDEELTERFSPGKDRQKPNQDDIVDGLVTKILNYDCIPEGLAVALRAKVQETDKNPRLRKHVMSFSKENTSDFFIHKDLGGFLRQELDFYIKNEVFRLDDLDTENEVSVGRYVKRAKVLRSIAGKIIDFLAQLEDFQRMLWEKKKFVLQTGYCMTIDHIPEAFYKDILNNELQITAWRNLYCIGENQNEQTTLICGQIDKAFLKNHPYLVLDTAFFNADFTDRLLENLQHPDGTPITDFDNAVGGLMVKSENWQALNLFKERFKEQINCIYIDPPYNTGNDEFIYRDTYQHSSWLSMLGDRLILARSFLNTQGVIYTSIDDNEFSRLIELENVIFKPENYVNNIIWQKKYAPQNDAQWFSTDHDFITVYAKDKLTWHPLPLPRTEDQNSLYNNPDNDPRGPWMSDNFTCNKSAIERPNLYYQILHPISRKAILPSTSNVWRYSPEEYDRLVRDNRVWWGINGKNNVPRYKRFLKEVGGRVPQTLWFYNEVGHNQDAVRELKALFGIPPFTSPKPTKLISRILQISPGNAILDFFAGSGTTAHSVLNINKIDGGKRKYILIEIGDYFATVMKPRIEKIMYSANWDDGKPQDTEGQSHIFKYMELEQYEDTLDNIEFLNREGQLQATIFGMSDYMLRYFLKVETKESACRLNVDQLASPFAYTLKIRRDSGFNHMPVDEDGYREVAVDIVETFNYLLGLHVKRRIARHNNSLNLSYRIVHGVLPDGSNATIVWRNCPKNPVGHEGELAEDLRYISENILAEFPNTGTLYVNGHCFVPRAKPIEPEFKKRMGA
jgi:adenine-specific DNA-methyltransferase